MSEIDLKSRSPHRQRKLWERVLEVVPASLTWGTFIAAVYFSATHPAWAAVYIIAFDTYWVLKAINTTFHLLSSYNQYQHDLLLDWQEILKKMKSKEEYISYLKSRRKKVSLRWRGIIDDYLDRYQQAKNVGDYRDIYHVVLFPFVDESLELLRASVLGVKESNYPNDRIIILLASEERAGEEAYTKATILKEEFEEFFRGFLIGRHPDGLPGEIRGKSANASFAAEHVLKPWLSEQNISKSNVVISNLDSDTIIHKQFLGRVSFEWLLAENPHMQSYQPITLYNNNIWDSPALVRTVAVANSFWQFMESSRPDRLRTFSSHSMSFKTLDEVGYWKKDVVNEDSCIFWQCYFHYGKKYIVKPVFIPVSMDTCLADTYKQTLVNQYKQKRRWAYNVEYFPWFTKNLWGSRKIDLYNKTYKYWQYIEGNYNWATASVILAIMGFLPSFLGGDFTGTVLGFNLPIATKLLMNIAIVFLIFSVYVNMVLLPPRPKKYTWKRTAAMYLQWALVPFISIFWGSMPAVDAQTRVALGKYMEFWVTPKARPSDYQIKRKKEAFVKTSLTESSSN